MLNEVRNLQADPVRLSLRAEELLLHEDCDSLQVGMFLKLQSAVIARSASVPLDTTRCAWTASPVWFVAGIQSMDAGDLELAEKLLKRALVFARTESVYRSGEVLQALGVICIEQTDYKGAIRYFSESYEQTPFEIPPIYLSNLGFATFASGDCLAAIHWCDVGWERLAQLEEDREVPSEIYVNDYNVMALNRLQAAMALGDEELAQESFDRISFHRPFIGWESAAVAILTNFTQWSDQPSLFLSLRGQLQKLLQNLDHEDINTALGANAALFDQGLTEAKVLSSWKTLRAVPVALRGGIEGHCQDIEMNRPLAKPSDWRVPLAMGAGFLMVLAIAGGVWGRREQKRRLELAELVTFPDDALRALVAQSLDRPAQMEYTPMRMARARLAYHLLIQRQKKLSLEHLPQWKQWSETSREIALSTARGEQTKLLALRLNLPVSSVYKVRMELRDSLGLAEDVSLNEWLKSQAQ